MLLGEDALSTRWARRAAHSGFRAEGGGGGGGREGGGGGGEGRHPCHADDGEAPCDVTDAVTDAPWAVTDSEGRSRLGIGEPCEIGIG